VRPCDAVILFDNEMLLFILRVWLIAASSSLLCSRRRPHPSTGALYFGTMDESSVDDANPKPAARRKAPPNRSARRRKRAEVENLKETVEHLVVVGNHHRHQNWRRNEHEKTSRAAASAALSSSLQEEEGKYANEEVTGLPAPEQEPKGRALLLHAEDLQIYGRLGLDDYVPWPNPHEKQRRRMCVVSDKAWEEKWGDSVNPCAFSAQRLSAAVSSLDETAAGAKADLLHPDQMPQSVDLSQATRSILLRCWHRAVHAASKVTVLDVDKLAKEHATAPSTGDGNEGDLTASPSLLPNLDADAYIDDLPSGQPVSDLLEHSSSDDSNSSSDDSHSSLPERTAPSSQPVGEPPVALLTAMASASRDADAFSPERAKVECDRLGILLVAQQEGPFCCPVCRTDMGTWDLLQSHYYGMLNARGCAWARIQRGKEKLLDETLQSEVALQIKQLVRLVGVRSLEKILQQNKQAPSEASNPVGMEETGPLTRPPLDWKHVESILTEVVASARSTRREGEETPSDWTAPILETTHTPLSIEGVPAFDTVNLPPLLLNPGILQATSHRLIERYTRISK
jgi:hypothetical protein